MFLLIRGSVISALKHAKSDALLQDVQQSAATLFLRLS